MNLYDWITLYHKKTGHPFNPPPGAQMEFDERYGFCTWQKDGQIFYICDTCGNGTHWEAAMHEKAVGLGCTTIRFGTYRNPAAFTRKFGYKVVGFILEKEVK